MIDQLLARTHAESPEALEQLAGRLARRDRLAQEHTRALDTLARMTGASPLPHWNAPLTAATCPNCGPRPHACTTG
ncbi:hypothetical protein RAA17_11370 [Komagataeibacter rhaeticus]|nr:hypothetical protein [Komagataeibacter rhaeticus]